MCVYHVHLYDRCALVLSSVIQGAQCTPCMTDDSIALIINLTKTENVWKSKQRYNFYPIFSLHFTLLQYSTELYFSQKQLPSAWNESDWLANCKPIHIINL